MGSEMCIRDRLVIAADDITGAGIANDSALPSLISGFTKGAEMLLGG